MAHAKINLQRMLAWIEQRLGDELPAPGDAEICDAFNFTSPEQARTLLAELADAGRITIRGWGADRTIALGRVASPRAAAVRPAPSVQRRDPELEAGLAKIAAIVARGRRTPPAAHQPTSRSETQPKETTMPAYKDGKYISLPADGALLRRMERYAEAEDLALGAAAAELAARGLKALDAEKTAPEAISLVAVGSVLAAIAQRAAARAVTPEQAVVSLIEDAIAAAEEALQYDAADLGEATALLNGLASVPTRDMLEELGARLERAAPAAERDAAVARAEAAEGQLATVRAQAQLLLEGLA